MTGYFLIVCAVLFIVFFGCATAKKFLLGSDLFSIKEIDFDEPSIQFIRTRELLAARGKNIFQADLGKIAASVNRQYPQIVQLKIVRKFPDRIGVSAKKIQFALQLEHGSRYHVLDQDGIVLFDDPKPQPGLLVVKGVKVKGQSLPMGFQVQSPELVLTRNIQRAFRNVESLHRYILMSIDMTNLAKIELVIQSGLKILIDQDKADQSLETLGMLLAQNKINWNQISYVDLRFKEPIVQQKEAP